MPSRERKDTPIAREKRIMASLEVHLSFIDSEKFNVYELDPLEARLGGVENKIKYFGKVTPDKKGDECSCDSWWYGMQFEPLNGSTPDSIKLFNIERPPVEKRGESRYLAENGYPFECKHTIQARRKRFGENPQ